MKLTETDISFIQKSYNNIVSKHDLLALLNYIKPLIYGEKVFLFTLKDLNYHINYKSKDRYKSFTIPKRSGKDRTIYAPNNVLKSFQKCLNVIFQVVYKTHPSATGFILGKSIVDNAKVHTSSNYVYNLDLKDFFHSIEQPRIWARLQHPPFNLNLENGNIKIANIIAFLCCHEINFGRFKNKKKEIVKRNALPQGAPTSPIISNIICQRLDFYLSAAARKFGTKYTRYADDITFSSVHNVYEQDSPFIIEIKRIIKAENFIINKSKVRLQENAYRQVVTGLVVNEQVNVSKRYIKELRMWLFFWETYGLTKANSKFVEYRLSKGVNKGRLPEVLKGKLDYLKMVKGESNLMYLKLCDRFNKQVMANNSLVVGQIKQKEADKFTVANFNLRVKPEFHTPRKLVKLLSNFTSGSFLKYSTHSWEQAESYNDFIEKIQRDWNKIENDMFALNLALASKIKMFLDSDKVEDKGWGSTYKNERIYFGWKGKLLKDWCDKNPNSSPFYFPIPTEKITEYDGIRTNYFYDVAEIFKRQIEVREENNHLHNIFLDLRKKYLGYDFNLELVNTKGVTFFTDVNSFKNACIKIFESVRKRPQFPSIKIKVEHVNGIVDIKIIQQGSICNRPIGDGKILMIKTGDFVDIKNNLRNLCDWSIEANFNDGNSYRINYLTSNKYQQKIEKIDDSEGFTFNLKFYV